MLQHYQLVEKVADLEKRIEKLERRSKPYLKDQPDFPHPDDRPGSLSGFPVGHVDSPRPKRRGRPPKAAVEGNR